MATPCTNSLGGESGGQRHEGCGGRSACWKYAAVSGSGAGYSFGFAFLIIFYIFYGGNWEQGMVEHRQVGERARSLRVTAGAWRAQKTESAHICALNEGTFSRSCEHERE